MIPLDMFREDIHNDICTKDAYTGYKWCVHRMRTKGTYIGAYKYDNIRWINICVYRKRTSCVHTYIYYVNLKIKKYTIGENWNF